MKILKLSDNLDVKSVLRKEALKGCDRCPCCGETEDYSTAQQKNEWSRGIGYVGARRWFGTVEGRFSILHPSRNRHWRVEEFSCFACGAEWESDPYEV